MGRITRRHFVHRTALAAGALCGLPLANLAAAASVSPDEKLNPAAIRKFSSSISGPVITPESPEYESARLVFNRAFDLHPGLIVRCANATDIGRALEFAQGNSLSLAVRGGGHSRAGFGTCEGGIVIDLSGLKGVEVDTVKRVATARAGALAGEMDAATQQHGLATVMGGCSSVGIAGLTLGGGEGLLMSKYGAACDNLISAQVVTVDGKQIEASASSNPDLFWAIRGGGGNFGVVTSLQYRLYPLTDVLSGTMTYAPGRIPELLRAFSKFVSAAPDEMNVVGEVLPSAQGARFHMMICHCGDPSRGRKLLAPLRNLKPQNEAVRVASYLETQRTINPYSVAAHFQTNLFLPDLNDAAIAAIETATNDAPPTTRVFIVPLYGAISRVKSSETAFPLREPGYELDLMGRWTDPGEKASAVGWVKALRDKLQPLARGVYANQLGETSEDLVKTAYSLNYARLVEMKKKYDPNNVLRMNQNIKPN